MNDTKAFERDVAEAFDREGRGRPVPDAIHDELLTYAGRTRQRPIWLASIKEPPMRLSNHIAVGSPTLRATVILAATLLLIAAVAAGGIVGQRLLAADLDADHVVAADGSGTHTTIADAVAAAQDGETVLVRNGTYAESVTISNDIELFGESRDGVIIEFAAGCVLEGEGEPWEKELVCDPDVPQLDGYGIFGPGPYALHLLNSAASIHDLTFRHVGSNGFGLYILGGAPTVSEVTFADNTFENPIGSSNIMVRGESPATFTDNDFGIGTFEIAGRSPVTVENNTLGALLSNGPLSDERGPSIFRGNTMVGMIWADGLHLIEGNEITLPVPDPFETAGVFIASGAGWVIEGNTIRNSMNPSGAIDIANVAREGVVIDNELEGNLLGIAVATRYPVRIEGNHVRLGDNGISSLSGTVELIDNTVEDMTERGIQIGREAMLSGNVACGNGVDLVIGEIADVEDDGSNEFCVVDDLREQ